MENQFQYSDQPFRTYYVAFGRTLEGEKMDFNRFLPVRERTAKNAALTHLGRTFRNHPESKGWKKVTVEVLSGLNYPCAMEVFTLEW
jgi:hypothetical protein